MFSFSFASHRKSACSVCSLVDTESSCFVQQGRDERNAQQTREEQVGNAVESRDFQGTKFQDIICTQSIFCYGTWPSCWLACALHRKLMSFDSWTMPFSLSPLGWKLQFSIGLYDYLSLILDSAWSSEIVYMQYRCEDVKIKRKVEFIIAYVFAHPDARTWKNASMSWRKKSLP